MDKRHIGPTELARRMDTSRNQVSRLLDPGDVGINLRTLDKVTKALDASFEVVIGEEKRRRSAGQRRRA
jgi:DNA-binding Xre family transcriptional regulator